MTCEKRKGIGYLKCNTKRKGCSQRPIRESDIFKQLNEEYFDNMQIPESMIENIKLNVRDYLKKDNDNKASVKKSLTVRLSEIKIKEEKLFNAYISDKCNEETYNKMKAQIETEKKEIESSFNNYEETDKETAKILEIVSEIAVKAPKMLKSPIISERKAILNLLLSDSVIEGKNLRFSMLSPFDRLLKEPSSLTWCGMLSDYRTQNVAAIDSLTKKIEKFKLSIQCLEL
jgi:hypothetical protein